jgi:threonine dehydrogenase-like Zn-dependent dehydrogenase
MRALRIENGDLNIEEIPIPKAKDEALVRVLKSGVCGTDLELVKGYSGFSGTPGHEFVGVVESSIDRPELIGKRVVGEINAGCGQCELCVTGDSRHCPIRTVLGIVGRDGAHAEFLKLPSRNLFEAPANVSDAAAVFVEPLAAAIGINERCEFQPQDRVAVIGDGKLGILCARGLSIMPLIGSLMLIGKNDEKLSLASKSGIETIKVDRTGNLQDHFDVVVEASGSESGFDTAMQIIKPRGRIVLKSTYHGLTSWDVSRLVVNEVTVIGSRCGRFQPALELLSSNQIEVLDLISEEFSLSNGVAAFERAGRKGVLKVLINAAHN